MGYGIQPFILLTWQDTSHVSRTFNLKLCVHIETMTRCEIKRVVVVTIQIIDLNFEEIELLNVNQVYDGLYWGLHLILAVWLTLFYFYFEHKLPKTAR